MYVTIQPQFSALQLNLNVFEEVESRGTSTFVLNDSFTFNNVKLQHCYSAKKKLESKGWRRTNIYIFDFMISLKLW